MNSDALVAALGTDAVDAVHGYRLRVIAEAAQRGLRLVSEALFEVEQGAADVGIGDRLDIRLMFHHSRRHGDLAGRLLRWDAASGWALSHVTASGPLCYFAGAGATPLDLVPDPRHVVLWATGELSGPATRPRGVELDDDPEAVQRLLNFLDPEYRLHLGDGTSPEEAGHGSSSTRRRRWAAPSARRSPNPLSRDVERTSRHEQLTG
jgi:hypothetical protein